MSWIDRARHHLRAAFRALPLECLATGAAVLSLWALVASDGSHAAARCFFSAVLAVPLLFAVTLLRRAGRVSARTGAALSIASVLGAVAMGARGLDLEAAFAWRFGLALLAAVMIPFLAAAAAAPREERMVGFADFVRRFTEETTASGLLLAAALIAIGVLVFSLEKLFHMQRILGMRLENAGVDAAGAIAGLFALGYLHRLLPGGAPGRVPELWRRLIARVAAPFLVAMLGILVAYEAWVVASGQVPVNVVSPLIIAAGALGFASTLVIESLVAVREQRALSPADPHPWTAARPVRLSRGFAAVLLALLPLAMWALWVRIDQHGLTPMRAARMDALACLGVLALWGTARWLRRRGPLTWQVPALAAFAALAGAVGPLSVVDLSIRSQTDRLEAALDRAGVTARVVLAAPPASPRPLGWDDFHDLEERIGELAELGGRPALARVLSGDLEPCASRWSGDRCLAHLGLTRAEGPGSSFRMAMADPGLASEIDGVRMREVVLDSGAPAPATMGALSLSLRGRQLVCDLGGGHSATADLSPSIDGWFDSGTLGPLPPLVDDAGCVRGRVLGRQAQVERTPGGSQLVRLEGVWVVPRAPVCP